MKIDRSLADLRLLSVLVIVYAILSHRFEFYEAMNGWLQVYEHWELDEILMTSGVLVLLLIWYAWRRFQEAAHEAKQRIVIEQELRQIHHELAQRVDQRTQEWQQTALALQAEIRVREQVEQELRNAHHQLQQTHELYRSAIMAIDGVPYEREYVANTLTFMGEAICAISGYEREEITPALWEELALETIMRGDLEGLSVTEAIHRTRSGEFQRWRCDTRLRTRTGQERWVADASVEIYQDQEKPVGSIGILIDITEQKQAEAELQETNRRLAEALTQLQQTQHHLIQQERLSAMGTMASGIAHDFNNLLAPILGFTELLLLRLDSQQPPAAKERRYLETIHTAAQNATMVVSRLREFYRYRDAQEPQQPVDLQAVVKEAILLTQPHWKDQALANGILVQVETTLQPVPLIVGNKAELQEMLTNLILNAVHALRCVGKITIRTYTDHYPHSSGLSQPVPAAVLTVSDTGVGMDEETQRRCFEPFFSTKGNHGTGLGLAAVYGIIQRHGGTIAVVSAPGQGTTFLIYLPVPVHLPTATPPVLLPATRKCQVLVIDDDAFVRDVIVESLHQAQHQVETAIDGQEGLEKFRTGHFDLVITDRAMPNLNGDGVASAIKKLQPATPVILLTGFGELMKANGELPQGVDYVMSKPFTFTMLQQTIAQVMDLL